MKPLTKAILSVLLLVTVLIWLAVIATPEERLHIVICDVGQGDAILMYKKTTQVLIDGGVNTKVMGCLANHIPFWDRTIEMVVLTHPDRDHYFGLTAVSKQYHISKFLANELGASTEEFALLIKRLKEQNTERLYPIIGDRYRFGNTHLTIKAPFETVKKDTNSYSIVMKLQEESFTALFTGDTDPPTSDDLAKDPDLKNIVALKVPHHGSKNGMTQSLLDTLNPQVALISVGKNNSYGHPSPEILDMLNNKGIKIYRTDQNGEIDLVTDGKTYTIHSK
jgi:competence protein ComEC